MEVGGTGVNVLRKAVLEAVIPGRVEFAVKVWATIVPMRSCGGSVGEGLFKGRQAVSPSRLMINMKSNFFTD